MAGFIGFENNLELACNANEIQKHRGPDGQHTWNDNHLALAHQRLSIIDLSPKADQPFHKENLVIVFNGEIYNYKELKETILKVKKIDFVSNSDTEIILEYYLLYGEKCLDYFVGMFAFAIYNTLNKNLFIARDHFGIKPLFYTLTKYGFAFASELKSLVQIPGFDKSVNYKSLVSSLNYVWVSGNETMFNNCYKLPPANYIIVKPDLHFSLVKYWHLPEKKCTDSPESIVKELRKALVDSVKRHMVADVPVSSFLSGGLDSSLISVLMAKYEKNLSTYTIGTSAKDKKVEQMPDDQKFAKELAELHHFNHHEIIISADIVKMLPKMVRSLDEPIGDPSAINTFIICEAARKRGIKVLLSGMGADEIFGGYRKSRAVLYALQFKKLPYTVQKIIHRFVNILPVKILGRGILFTRWTKRFLGFASLPLEEAFMRSYSYYSRGELNLLFKENHELEVDLIFKEHSGVFNSGFNGDVVNQMCNTDVQMFLLGLNLTCTDRASMAASVEVRVPYVDKEFLSYSMSIPGVLKIKNGESKFILKKVAEKILPLKIVYRPKAPFSAPIRSWMSNELKPLVDELLSREVVEKRGLFNYSFIKHIIDEDRNGFEDNAYRIYQLLTVELWFREFIDK